MATLYIWESTEITDLEAYLAGHAATNDGDTLWLIDAATQHMYMATYRACESGRYASSTSGYYWEDLVIHEFVPW